MNKEHEKLDVQDAPDKNTDSAYVKVGSDGKPEMPANAPADQDTNDQRPKEGTLADR